MTRWISFEILIIRTKYPFHYGELLDAISINLSCQQIIGRWYGRHDDYSVAACKLFCINKHMLTSVAPGTHRYSCYREIFVTACVIHNFSETRRHCDTGMSGLPFALRDTLRT